MRIKPGISELLKSSVRAILKNKSRTILTSLGIIIGVTSVILLTSIGTGLKSYVSDQFESLGANTVYISPGQVFSDSGGFSQGGSMMINKFTLKDVESLERKFRNLAIMPFNTLYASIESSNTTKNSMEINGTTPEYGPNSNLVPSEGNGRWFTQEEVNKKTPVIIVGNKLAKDLFPNGNALGKTVIIKGKTLKIIGVTDSTGGGLGQGIDSIAVIPITVAYLLSGNQDISAIMVQAPDKDSVPTIKKDLTKFMETRYDEDAFTVFDSSQLLSSINSIISILTAGLSGIAAISLVVGGIGIMNIMLVSVTERTKEIGLRKAIGAYPRAILLQFIIEAVILSCLGGGIGILLGYLGSLAINSFFPAKVTLNSVILAFGVSSLVGIIFGVAPARKASKLSPIEALRYE
jgi:putative ABC transport system permease protein